VVLKIGAGQERWSLLVSDNLTFEPVAWIFTDYAKLKGLRPRPKRLTAMKASFETMEVNPYYC